MEIDEAIDHRLEVREYADEPVEESVKRRTLDAGRLAPSGKNSQHWRFVLVEDGDALDALADASVTGGWVRNAAYAVVVCTDPSYEYHELDAGRAITHMQQAAWEHGVGSCIYTGLDRAATRSLFGIPDAYEVPGVIGFGYPTDGGAGRKQREPLSTIARRGHFEEPFEAQ